jgi:hypothetical protein
VLVSPFPATARAGEPSQFGISTGGTIQNEDAATLANDLDAIQAVGSRWVRIDINWAAIQAGGPSSYNWAPFDRVVQGAAERGINVLGVIAYTPEWARPAGTNSHYGADPAQFAAFASVAVQRYAALGVHTYEVWNEPNVGAFWGPSPDPGTYTSLLKATYPAIKAADAGATVLTGGTAPSYTDGTNYSPVDWLTAIYANGGGDSFDAVSHHPYCWPADPGDAESWSAWWQLYGTNPSLRSVMVDHGDRDKQIWGTEFGAPTNGPPGSHVSENEQARMISKAYALWGKYRWAGPLFTYQARDIGTSTDTRENFFGLLRNDYSPKPAYGAYKAAADSAAMPEGEAPDSGPGADDTTTDSGPGADDTTTRTDDGSNLLDTDATMTRGDEDSIFPRVKIKVRGRGAADGASANVKGRVWTRRGTSPAASVASATLRGKVTLRLYRRDRRGGAWRAVSPSRTSKVSRTGRFKRSVHRFGGRKLRRGAYRIRARYRGTLTERSALSWSPRFRVRR